MADIGIIATIGADCNDSGNLFLLRGKNGKTFEMVTCADGFLYLFKQVSSTTANQNRYQPRIRKCGTWLPPNRPCIFIKDYAEDPDDLTGRYTDTFQHTS